MRKLFFIVLFSWTLTSVVMGQQGHGGGGGSVGLTIGDVVTGGTDGRLFYNNGGLLGEASIVHWDDVLLRFGIGTVTPGFDFELLKDQNASTYIRVTNPDQNNNAVIAGFYASAGVGSGTFAMIGDDHMNANVAGYLILNTDLQAAGINLYASHVGDDILFYAGADSMTGRMSLGKFELDGFQTTGNLFEVSNDVVGVDSSVIVDALGHIGVNVQPSRGLHVHDDDIQLTDPTSGTGLSDGLLMQQLGLDSFMGNQETGDYQIFTDNGLFFIHLETGGQTGFNTTDPSSTVDMLLADATTNVVTTMMEIDHTGGTVVAGFGSDIAFNLEENDGTNRIAGLIGVQWDDAGETTDADASMTFSLMTADAVATEYMRIDGTKGDVILSTGQLLMAGGTSGAPGMSYADDPNTGFFQTTDGQINVSVNGVNTFDWFGGGFRAAATGGAGLQNTVATATVPTLLPRRNDSNTGIGSALADQLSLIAGGVEGIRIGNTGVSTLIVSATITEFNNQDNHREATDTADDGFIDLATGVAGYGSVMAGDNQAWAQFTFTSAGVVTLGDFNGSVVATDTDTNLCIFDNGTNVRISNRLGAMLFLNVNVSYVTP